MAEAQAQFQASPRGICGGKVTLGQVFLQVFQFPLHSQCDSTDASYSSINLLKPSGSFTYDQV
jgi:hypothetical protein